MILNCTQPCPAAFRHTRNCAFWIERISLVVLDSPLVCPARKSAKMEFQGSPLFLMM